MTPMPLEERPRLSHGVREKIGYRLRRFYDRLLVERIPERISATFEAEPLAKQSSSPPLPPKN